MTTATPEPAPCAWPVDTACFTEEWNALPEDVRVRSVNLASSSLRALTAYRVGGCPVTVRPQVRRGMCFVPYQDDTLGMRAGFMHPGLNQHGQWVNAPASGVSRDDVFLPPPVYGPVEVRVGSTVLSPMDYRIDNGCLLVWQGDGPAPWPNDQDFSLRSGQEGVFEVTYLNAYPVTANGAYAAAVLAMEFAKACSGSRTCRLPAGVTSIVRQGVSMEIASGMFPDGKTGIREVDAYLFGWNPKGRTRPTTVWTPGNGVRTVRGA